MQNLGLKTANPCLLFLKFNISVRSQYFAKIPKVGCKIWIQHLCFSFPELQIWSGMSSTTPLSRIKDRSIWTRRIDTCKKVFFYKSCFKSYNLMIKSLRMVVKTPLSSTDPMRTPYVILSKFCKESFFKILHSPCQDCTCPPALKLDLWRTGCS